MSPDTFNRLHKLRMDNDAKGFAMDEMRPRFDALRTRHEDGTAPRAVSAFNLFQTPPDLAARMVGLAGITPGHSVLEPQAGLGRILRAIMAKGPGANPPKTESKAFVMAVEESTECCAELYREFPNVVLHQGDFLARHHGFFDRIVMNPPFKMKRDIKHILHARKHLQRGGVLVGLCLDGHKREEALRPLCDHWEQVPAGAFKAEGTGVPTILFRMEAQNQPQPNTTR